MRVGIPRETAPRERRVALTPDVVQSHLDHDRTVLIESDAGAASGYTDAQYRSAGAEIVDRASALASEVVICVQPIPRASLAQMGSSSWLIGLINPLGEPESMRDLADRGIVAFSLEQLPRTTIAQSMDVLSSQATAGGYAAALLGAREFPGFLPMLITAAGTLPPAKALVLGVGVAGLQAIATLRRLGAAVSAYDIRPETKEQVESLGAKFVAAPTQSFNEGGYARAVDDDLRMQQQEALAAVVAKTDILITTAQVPGRTAPVLVTAEMVQSMAPGSVIVDMAAGSGGNVVGSVADEPQLVGGVSILGPTDLPSQVPAAASRMFAKNATTFLNHLTTGESLDFDDDIVDATCITSSGAVRNERVLTALDAR
ncbi:MAG: NAD(P) transhydrogenase subunit alpha [Acidimicrobiia bacterium]|nr:NAD(P) transhydrogenase subunit alpha [Acidimicrobiia bacterium]